MFFLLDQQNYKNISRQNLKHHTFLDVNEVKAKIHHLRGYYSKELQREKASKKSGSATNEIYQSTWPHFNSLHFLRDVIIPRKTQSNIVSIRCLNVVILP